MSEMFEKYFEETFHKAISSIKGLLMRTVPVEQCIVPEHSVAVYDDAIQLLKRADIIAVADFIGQAVHAVIIKGMIGRTDQKRSLKRRKSIYQEVFNG